MKSRTFQSDLELERAYEAILWLKDYLESQKAEALRLILTGEDDCNLPFHRAKFRLCADLLSIIDEAVGAER